jgi:ABC-2 type transport system permease protein
MTVLEVARQTLWQSRRSIVGWMVGIAAITLLYASSYHSVSGAKADAINRYPASLKQALNLQDLTSPSGYLNSTVFGIPLLLLTSVFAISTAARAVAGDEDSGALDLWLSYPVSRAQLILGRLLSMVTTLAMLACVLFLEVTALRTPTSLRVDTGDLAATCLTWLLFAGCLAALALLASATIGRRSPTLAVTSALALLAYLCASFLPLITALGWTRSVSPYYWFLGGDPLANGLQLGHCGLLLGVAAVAAVLAVMRLNGRDLRV